jgi:hypothetical protein
MAVYVFSSLTQHRDTRYKKYVRILFLSVQVLNIPKCPEACVFWDYSKEALMSEVENERALDSVKFVEVTSIGIIYHLRLCTLTLRY